MNKMKPAEYIIYAFGGVRATARAIGRSPGAVSLWQKNNFLIPNSAQQAVLNSAKELGIDITPKDIIYGRYVSKREKNKSSK